MKNFEKRDSIRAERMIEIATGVEKAVDRNRPADRELARIFRQNRRFGSHDRRIYSSAVFSLMRWRGWTGTVTDAGPKACISALLLDAQEISPHIAALADSLNMDQQSLRPLGQLDLDAKGKALAELGFNSSAPSYRTIVPEWSWSSLPFEDESQQIAWADAIQGPMPVWLRLDRGHEDDSRRFLTNQGVELEQHADMSAAWMTETNISRAVLNAREAGHIHLQDLTSQAVVQACYPAAQEQWWDACAGAGGKSLQLANLLADSGGVVATDTRSVSLRNLHKRASRAEIRNIRTENLDATNQIPKETPFDGVLVDAPCSGVGTWGRNPDARWRTDRNFVENRARLQLKLLDNAANAVNTGGKLVYAVCSLLLKETRNIVSNFTDQHPQFKPTAFKNPLDGAECDGSCLLDGISDRSIAMFIAVFKRV